MIKLKLHIGNRKQMYLSFDSIKYIISVLFVFLLLSCHTKENVIGTWTYMRKIKDGKEIRREREGRLQIRFLNNGEMIYLTNGERSGIGFYSYKIVGDSIYRTNIQVDSTGKRDSVFIGSNKFSLMNDTLTIDTDKGTIFFKKEIE